MIKIMKEWVGPFAILLLKRIRVQHHRLSLSKTIYFNFKCLPFRQACKLPIFIYHNTSIYRIGKIEIKSKEIFQGMIQWGKLGYKSSGKGKICNNGKIEFEGPVFWWGGCILENNGTMVFKGYTQIGEGTLILIRDYLEIGRYTRIEIGTIIVVKPGEKIPIDGIVVSGESTLNTSALTGESLPRSVKVKDEVISGCVNLTGLLKIETTKEFGESTVSKILDLVENSSMKKSRSENFITRFSKVYTPAVCIGALVLAVIPPVVSLIMGNPAEWSKWLIRALTTLVISCPCALVISIPLSFFGGIGGASSRGILIKGSNYLENLSKAKYVVCDKTGTLTKGVFEVTDVITANGFTKEDIIKSAAYAESYSSHPISKSIRDAYGMEVETGQVTDIEEISGHGVKADIGGKKVLAGNLKLMNKYNIDSSAGKDSIENALGTLVYVAIGGIYAGCIVISDVIKPTSQQAIAALKKAGVKKVIMLTGDAKKVAEQVAGKLGVDEVKSELLPADKVIEVEKLLNSKGKDEMLAFVGDGINDAPVLSRADIGIAMGALGSDAAIEAADIVLMDDDPAKIATAMNISRKTLRIVHQNIVFALAIKIACLALGAAGVANMWMAIFADVGVMVLAVLNATRCLSYKD